MKKEKIKVVNGNVKNGKMALSTKLALKICEPYMTEVLKACYDLRTLSYAMTFEKWCERVNEQLKINLQKRKESQKC